MYELYMTQGQGGDKVAEFDTLVQALEEFELYKNDGSFGIKCPDGSWFDWSKYPNE